MRRVASSPSSSGMRMSIKTTAGRKRAAFSTASSPLLASATTSMSGSPESSMRKPARTIDWSSATRTRTVIGFERCSCVLPVKGEARAEDEAPVGCGPRVHLAAVDLHPFADADEAVAETVGRRGARAVVDDFELDLVGAITDDHVGVAGVRVLERVGQALLHDPIRRQLDRAREREGVTVHVQPDRKPGAADVL